MNIPQEEAVEMTQRWFSPVVLPDRTRFESWSSLEFTLGKEIQFAS